MLEEKYLLHILLHCLCVFDIKEKNEVICVIVEVKYQCFVGICCYVCMCMYVCSSSMVSAFDHGAMGRRLDPSWWTHERFLVPASGMCHPVCGIMHIKEPLLLIGKSSPCGRIGWVSSLAI